MRTFKNTHTQHNSLLPEQSGFVSGLRHHTSRTRDGSGLLPYFQLIQTFQELPGAVCHGQRPAELAAGGFVHLRLDFRLSHAEEVDDDDDGSVSFIINPARPRPETTARPVKCLSLLGLKLRPMGGTFPNKGRDFPLPPPCRKFPRRPD